METESRSYRSTMKKFRLSDQSMTVCPRQTNEKAVARMNMVASTASCRLLFISSSPPPRKSVTVIT